MKLHIKTKPEKKQAVAIKHLKRAIAYVMPDNRKTGVLCYAYPHKD